MPDDWHSAPPNIKRNKKNTNKVKQNKDTSWFHK